MQNPFTACNVLYSVQTSEDPVPLAAVNPGDNPNYSPMSMGLHSNLAMLVHTTNPIGCLDNPLYTKSNSYTDIVAGYSLVSLAEETSVYHSSPDEPTKAERPLYDSIRPTSDVKKPVCYSQPVLNKDNGGDEYDRAEMKFSCVRDKIEEYESQCSSRDCDELYEDYGFNET